MLELRHQSAVVARSDSLRGLAVKLSEAGLEPEVYLKVRNTFLELANLPTPGKSVIMSSEWHLWTVPVA